MTLPNSKLVLGTAQLGQKYGVANTGNSTGLGAAREIVDVARAGGISTIETSIAYKQSLEYLSLLGVADFDVIGKVGSQLSGDGKITVANLRSEIKQLQESCGKYELATVLIHNSRLLSGENGEEICSELQGLKSEGVAGQVGVSVYTPEELDLIPCLETLDVIQAPLNVFDSRFLQQSTAKKLEMNNLELHARSIFLQGLLLMSDSLRPKQFARWSANFGELEQLAHSHNVTKLTLCLKFATDQSAVKRIVIGADSADQLRELLNSNSRAHFGAEIPLSIADEELIDPRRWKK